ncbi:MAG: leucine-rich repeat domain-containing protein [Treponema sp.]|nr:leucine-rich repeat domain-containing protein [Treponema sp.]
MKQTMVIMLLLALLGCFTACTKYDDEKDFEIGDLKGHIDTEKSAAIYRYVGNKQDVSIPPRIQGRNILVIETGAFARKNLTSVIIPNGVTEIGQSAFARTQLTSVTIPNSVTSIKANAFQENQLTSVTIPNSVTTILSGAFQGNQLTSVTIPNSITRISTEVFKENPLTSVTLPADIAIGYMGLGKETEDGIRKANCFDGDLLLVYCYDNKKAAGTYTRSDANSETWIKQ